MDYSEMDMRDGNFFTKRNMKKKYAPVGVHVPNKNEAKLLRKIMSNTGLNESEVRKHYKYRLMLSTAQKSNTEDWDPNREMKRSMKTLMKSITKRLKLAKEHPTVVAEFIKIWNANYGRYPKTSTSLMKRLIFK